MHIMNLAPFLPRRVMRELPTVIEQFNLTRPHEVAQFLSQCHHVSNGFQNVFEPFYYSAADLLRLWPHKFRDYYDAEFHVGRPMHIAVRIYAGLGGNGSVVSGDGWTYRGRGYLRVQFRRAYEMMSHYMGEDLIDSPDYAATKYPLLTSAYYWYARDIGYHIKSKKNVTMRDTEAASMMITKTTRHDIRNRCLLARTYLQALIHA